MLINNCQLKPIVKWAGGKGQLIEDISHLYPQSLGFCLDKYAEPFVGGGLYYLICCANTILKRFLSAILTPN